MSLRFRLNALLTLIFLGALITAIIYLLAEARRAVTDELHASTVLTSALVHGILSGPLSPAEEANIEAVLEELEVETPIRHLRIRSLPAGGARTSADVTRQSVAGVPDWFSRLVEPESGIVMRVIRWRQREIIFTADPADEITEAWREARVTLGALVAVFVGSLLVVFTFLGRALRPLRGLSQALEGIGKGDYSSRLPITGSPDIDRLAQQFNQMAAVLAQSHADNDLLAQRSLAIQEEERRHLARELHDEMGQSITAIKALAVSIRERAGERDTTLAERAATIIDVSSEIYACVRQMMTRLHPVVVDELGLPTALSQMVDGWNSHHEDCFCRYHAARDIPSLTEAARIGLYRIAQEALTNIAKHAHASEAEVALSIETMGEPCLLLRIADNGAGLSEQTSAGGHGLLGIRERTHALGGVVDIDRSPNSGTTLVVRLPLARVRLSEQREIPNDTHTAG